MLKVRKIHWLISTRYNLDGGCKSNTRPNRKSMHDKTLRYREKILRTGMRRGWSCDESRGCRSLRRRRFQSSHEASQVATMARSLFLCAWFWTLPRWLCTKNSKPRICARGFEQQEGGRLPWHFCICYSMGFGSCRSHNNNSVRSWKPSNRLCCRFRACTNWGRRLRLDIAILWNSWEGMTTKALLVRNKTSRYVGARCKNDRAILWTLSNCCCELFTC